MDQTKIAHLKLAKQAFTIADIWQGKRNAALEAGDGPIHPIMSPARMSAMWRAIGYGHYADHLEQVKRQQDMVRTTYGAAWMANQKGNPSENSLMETANRQKKKYYELKRSEKVVLGDRHYTSCLRHQASEKARQNGHPYKTTWMR